MPDKEKKSSIRERLYEGRHSPLKTYIQLTVGDVGFFRFALYEFLTCFLGPVPGGIGFYLRKKFYPLLFRETGKGLIIGRNVIIRHPDKIEVGDDVTIDDNCLIDARGSGNTGIVIEDNVLINRNCTIQAKAGPIRLGKRTSIGSNSTIVSMGGVEFGKAVLVAGSCHFSAGLFHFEDIDTAVMDQGAYSKGPIHIGDNSWLGTGVIVLDGVNIGAGAVIGAAAVVNKDVPANTIAFGIPAKTVRSRF